MSQCPTCRTATSATTASTSTTTWIRGIFDASHRRASILAARSVSPNWPTSKCGDDDNTASGAGSALDKAYGCGLHAFRVIYQVKVHLHRRLAILDSKVKQMTMTPLGHKKAEQEARRKMSDFIDHVIDVIESTPMRKAKPHGTVTVRVAARRARLRAKPRRSA